MADDFKQINRKMWGWDYRLYHRRFVCMSDKAVSEEKTLCRRYSRRKLKQKLKNNEEV